MYPVLFRIGSFEVSSFGVMVAIAMLVGARVAARAFEDEGLPGDAAWSVLTWCIVGGLLGSKLWFVGEQLARHPDLPLLDSLLARAGLTWYGGLFGGAAAAWLGFRANGIDALRGFDASAPALALGHAIGRVGCLLVGDDYGVPSDLPWAIAFPQGSPPTELAVHPTMLYETLWLLPVALWLWRRRASSSCLIGEYLVLAGFGRFWIEALRTNPVLFAGLTNAQVVALLLVAGGAALWILRRGSTARAAPG